MHHYALIKNLKGLLQLGRNIQNRSANIVCRRCFNIYNSRTRLESHERFCLQSPPLQIIMPSPQNNKYVFKKGQSRRWFTPIIGFFDLESVIEPVLGCQNDPVKADTRQIEMHRPCSYAMLFLALHEKEPYHFSLNRGPDAMEKFIEELEKLAVQINKDKQRNRVFQGQAPIPMDQCDDCWICEKPLENTSSNKTVLDHCHFTGVFLGWSHNQCNLLRRKTNFTPVFAHNLSGYDMHHVVLALEKANKNSIITIIPNTDEKFVCLQIGIRVGSKPDMNGKIKNEYEYIRLLDSYRFMNESLDKLSQNLPEDAFELLDNHFAQWPQENINLLKQKASFPYSYVDSFSKLEETKLPERELWTNSLDQFTVSVASEEYNRACEVFKKFDCKTIGEYYDIYLTTDVFLLAAAMSCFRDVCYRTYGLDCCQYFTASNLSGDAMMKVCQPNIELLTERSHLDLVENMTRGGISSVFSERICTANNKDLPYYNPSKPPAQIIMLDANNLYGGVMENYALPIGSFELISDEWDAETQDQLLCEILATSDDSDLGYILEVDIDYPDELHDLHFDFPLAPEKLAIEKEWLSDYQWTMLDQMDRKKPWSGKKLVQTLFKKTRYVVHYITLKLYVKLGMKIEKVHQVLRFTQGKWLADYVKLNTLKRQQAKTKFEQNFYKLMVNSAFGKLCEGKRNRIRVKLVRSEAELVKLTDKPEFKTFKVLNKDLALVSLNIPRITWDKPTIVGSCILDLAKHYMFKFHYQIMKPNFNCTLLYSDTDSLIYNVTTTDFYKELREKEALLEHFDFSNFPKNQLMFNTRNERVTLKFKDEMGGKAIAQFIGLKPRLYSLQLAEGKHF